MKKRELIKKVKKYCNKKGYLILEEKEDHLIIFDRLMNIKKLPYFIFK